MVGKVRFAGCPPSDGSAVMVRDLPWYRPCGVDSGRDIIILIQMERYVLLQRKDEKGSAGVSVDWSKLATTNRAAAEGA